LFSLVPQKNTPVVNTRVHLSFDNKPDPGFLLFIFVSRSRGPPFQFSVAWDSPRLSLFFTFFLRSVFALRRPLYRGASFLAFPFFPPTKKPPCSLPKKTPARFVLPLHSFGTRFSSPPGQSNFPVGAAFPQTVPVTSPFGPVFPPFFCFSFPQIRLDKDGARFPPFPCFSILHRSHASTLLTGHSFPPQTLFSPRRASLIPFFFFCPRYLVFPPPYLLQSTTFPFAFIFAPPVFSPLLQRIPYFFPGGYRRDCSPPRAQVFLPTVSLCPPKTPSFLPL